MTRWLPYPRLSLALFIVWLLLNSSLHPAHLTLGLAAAWTIPWLLRPLLPELPRPRHPLVALRLLARFGGDVIIANLAVARLILGSQARLRSGYVWVPLDLREPVAITLLAGMVTMTPGTLAAKLSDDQRHLLVHGLHIDDAAALVDDIKQRYERPLQQIFEEHSR